MNLNMNNMSGSENIVNDIPFPSYDGTESYESLTQSLLHFNEEQTAIYGQFINILEEFNSFVKNSPLLKFIPIHMMIAGGAIRDLLLGHSHNIKDIDILFSPQLARRDPDTERFTNDTMNLIKERCIEHNILKATDFPQMFDSDIFYKLMEYAFSQHYIVGQSFPHIEPKSVSSDEGAYSECGIQGVLKIESFPLPVDLIFISNSCKEFVFKQFDYGICKVGLHKDWTNEIRFVFSPEFLSNVDEKEITYHVNGLANEVVERSLFTHLGRILQKYSDYSIKLLESNEEQDFLLQKALSYHSLKRLEIESNKKEKKSSKI